MASLLQKLWSPVRCVLVAVVSVELLRTMRISDLDKLCSVTKLLDFEHSEGVRLDETSLIYVLVRMTL